MVYLERVQKLYNTLGSMTREELIREVKSSKSKNILLELPTSYGKTRIALELTNLKKKKNSKVLIVIPRNVLISNWKSEIKKWKCSLEPEFVTYISLPKKAGEWDIVIFDECHHLSERCRKSLQYFHIVNSILLSATVKRDLKKEFHYLFPNLATYKVDIAEATAEGILPDPKVYLIPLELDKKTVNCQIVRNPKKGNPMTVPYRDKWKVAPIKNRKVLINCTEWQYYADMSSLIDWYKRRIHTPIFKNLYLHKCGERLKWLSNMKTSFVYNLLQELKNERTLTFCNSILQTEVLGKYCINSKNARTKDYLESFNKGKINHITACDMLNEGINLAECRVGIYASLNSSERMIIQKMGRLLRHPEPIIIIPYYKNTRDEEIVQKMCENYNPELVKIIKDIKDLIL